MGPFERFHQAGLETNFSKLMEAFDPLACGTIRHRKSLATPTAFLEKGFDISNHHFNSPKQHDHMR
jgi:hypothetical protein